MRSVLSATGEIQYTGLCVCRVVHFSLEASNPETLVSPLDKGFFRDKSIRVSRTGWDLSLRVPYTLVGRRIMIRNLTWIFETTFAMIKWCLEACRSDLGWLWQSIHFSDPNHLRTVLRSAPKPSFLWKTKPKMVVFWDQNVYFVQDTSLTCIGFLF